MFSPEELNFVNQEAKDNGFQKPASSKAKRTPKPVIEPEVINNEKEDYATEVEDIKNMKYKRSKREQTIRFTVDISEQLHTDLKMVSAEFGVPQTKLVRLAITNLINDIRS